MDTKYNGWTNYPTWRVNLEIVDEWASFTADDLRADSEYPRFPDVCALARNIEEMVMDVLTGHDTYDGPECTLWYAEAFVSHVNWDEIAESIIQDDPGLWIIQEEEEETSDYAGEDGPTWLDIADTYCQ